MLFTSTERNLPHFLNSCLYQHVSLCCGIQGICHVLMLAYSTMVQEMVLLA